jgi:hypothetical protein
MRLLCALLLLLWPQSIVLAQNLEEHIHQLNRRNSACSACNLVSRTLDAEAFSKQLVTTWKDATSAERSKEVKKSLKRSCKRLAAMEIGLSGTLQTEAFVDFHDLRKKGFSDFKDSKTGPKINKLVQDLCELIVKERASELVKKMEAWMAAGKKPRRLVDMRFNSDLKLCAGGVLSVCDSVFQDPEDAKAQPPPGEDIYDDDDDDGDIWGDGDIWDREL